MVGVVWGKRRSISYMKSRCVFFKFALFPFIQSQRSLSVKQGKLATGSRSPGIRELGTRYNTPFCSCSFNMNLRHLISSTSRSLPICFFGWSLWNPLQNMWYFFIYSRLTTSSGSPPTTNHQQNPHLASETCRNTVGGHDQTEDHQVIH